jgi:hypothetical protein
MSGKPAYHASHRYCWNATLTGAQRPWAAAGLAAHGCVPSAATLPMMTV